MDYHLLYTQRALNDLAEIIGHIADDDAEAASRFAKPLLDHLDLLTRFPRMGNIIRKRLRVRNCSIVRFLFTTRSMKLRGRSRFFTAATDRGTPEILSR